MIKRNCIKKTKAGEAFCLFAVCSNALGYYCELRKGKRRRSTEPTVCKEAYGGWDVDLEDSWAGWE